MIAEISSDEEEGFLEETPSATSITILEPAPITLRKSRTSEFTNDVDNQPTYSSSGQNQEDFTEGMNKKVQSILTEAVFYSNDPREYHPFYLEVEKVISSCQSLGCIGQNEEHIRTIWKEFDDLARRMKESGTAELRMPSELSPYALFIRSGKAFDARKVIGQNGEDKDNRFKEMKEKAKKIFKKWKSQRGNKNKLIRDDLDARLIFFKECKTVTSPSDVVQMNNIWREFLNEFRDQNKHPVPGQRILGRKSAESSRLNEIEVIEPPTSPEVIKIESEEDEALETPELRLSSFDQETRASKALLSAARINVAVETVPSKYQVRVLVEDIAKTAEWGRNVRLLLRKRPASPTTDMNTRTRRSKRVKREVIREDFVSFGKIRACSKKNKYEARGCDTPRISKATKNIGRVLRKRPSMKMKRVAVANQKILNSRKSGIRFRSENKKYNYRKCKRESEKVRNFRLKKFRKDWKRKRLELISICRRRRRWEQERRKRSEKIDMTLEYVITGQCKLRTLASRTKWFWKPLKKKTPSEVSVKPSKHSRSKRQPQSRRAQPVRPKRSTRNATKKKKRQEKQPKDKIKKTKAPSSSDEYKCPFCQIDCNSALGKLRHVRSLHPTQMEEYRSIQRKLHRKNEKIRRNEMRKRFRETGEGPKRLKAKAVAKKRPQPSPQICDECGGVFLHLKVHKETVHQKTGRRVINTRTACSVCGESVSDGTLLWHHFLSQHLNYDYMALSKLKGELMGFRYQDSVFIEGDDNDAINGISDGYFKSLRRPSTGGDPRVLQVGQSLFKCAICEKQFDLLGTVQRHVVNVHDKNQCWACPQCPKTFELKTSMESHVKQFHDGLEYRCEICSRKMQTKGKLWRHKVDVHGMSDLEPPEGLTVEQCTYCGETFLRGMRAHIRDKHPEKLDEYRKANKKEKSRLSEEAHKRKLERRRAQRRLWKEKGVTTVKWLMREVPKVCSHCGISTKDIDWDDHMKNEHGVIVESKKFACPVEGCGKSYRRSTDLIHHSMVHFILFEKLRQNEFVEETRAPFEYICKLCQKEGNASEGMKQKGEVMVHFALRHAEEYGKCRGPLEPDLGDLQIKEPLNQTPLSDSGGCDGASSVAISSSVKFPCSHCFTELVSHSALRDHVIELHPEECLECLYPDCSQILISSEEMEEHFSKQHNQCDE